MKYILSFLISFLLVHTPAKASYALNMVMTDTEGTEHNIYSYLDQGKTVLLDFYTYWCTPCQTASPHLENLWEEHGPNGDDTMVILGIEVSSHYDIDAEGIDLDALGSSWGASYPIINYNGIPDEYLNDVEVFPTYAVICPDKSYQVAHGFGAPQTLFEWQQGINTCNNLDSSYDAHMLNATSAVCGDDLEIELEIGNAGFYNIYGMSMDVYIDSEYISTHEWDNVLAPGQTTANISSNPYLVIDGTDFSAAADLNIEVVVNASGDENSSNDSIIIQESSEPQTPYQDIYITFQTDDYPADNAWELRDVYGNLIASQGYDDFGNVVGYGADETNTLFTYQYTLDFQKCYTFTMYDQYGDGICCNNGDGFYTITDTEGNLLGYNSQDFETQSSNVFTVDANVGIADLLLEPTTKKILKREYYNTNGQMIHKDQLLPNALYMVKTTYEDFSSTTTKSLHIR
jgi:thiol-disulfide isomerase/thioredoxin